MTAPFVSLPISVAWISERLYREKPSDFPFGRAVEVDGWDEALDAAWADLFRRPGVAEWVNDYLERRGAEGAVLSFRDTARVVGRYGYGNFNVTYPADLLLSGDDREAAMRTAILLVLDRHVAKSDLGLPPLTSVAPN